MSAKNRKTTKKPSNSAPRPAAKPQASPFTPGTVLRKNDREGKVRCECTVEAEGFRYKGKLYNSLSGAAAAAAKDLKLSGTSFNGYVFWGLKASGRDPLDRVEHFWRRYSNAAAALLKAGGPQKTAALERVRQHAAEIKVIAG